MKHLFFAATSALIILAGTAAKADDFAQGAEALDRDDHQTAIAVWHGLAEQDNPDALFNLAIMHLEGIGVAADPSRSVDFFERAARHGDPIAAYNLGELYAEGRGVDQDFAAAAEWYRHAAAHNYPEAMLKLANLHSTGQGVDKDVGLALRLMEQAQETECLLGETENNHHTRLVEKVIDSPH